MKHNITSKSFSPAFRFLNKLLLFRIVVFLMATAVLPSRGLAVEGNTAALNMVEKMGLGANLNFISYETILHTQTYLIIADTLGSEKSQLLIKEELRKAIPKYQSQWNKNLASCYAEVFTSEELEALSEKHTALSYANKLVKYQDQIGESMRAKSTHLMQSLVADVLSTTFSKIAPEK